MKKFALLIALATAIIPATVKADTSASCTITGTLQAYIMLEEDGSCISNCPVTVEITTERVEATVNG